MIFKNIKNGFQKVRQVQKIKSAYNKLAKKMCEDCKKKLIYNMVNDDEVKDFIFCDACDKYANEVIQLQACFDTVYNKKLVDDYNNTKKKNNVVV